jgi:hypothetical protein
MEAVAYPWVDWLLLVRYYLPRLVTRCSWIEKEVEWAEDKQVLYDVKLSVIRGYYYVYYLPIEVCFNDMVVSLLRLFYTTYTRQSHNNLSTSCWFMIISNSLNMLLNFPANYHIYCGERWVFNQYISTTYQVHTSNVLSAQIDQVASIGHTIFSQAIQSAKQRKQKDWTDCPKRAKTGVDRLLPKRVKLSRLGHPG